MYTQHRRKRIESIITFSKNLYNGKFLKYQRLLAPSNYTIIISCKFQQLERFYLKFNTNNIKL